LTGRVLTLILITAIFTGIAGGCSYKKKSRLARHADDHLHGALNHQSNMPFDSNLVGAFYTSYPLISQYQPEVLEVYRRHRFTHIWFDKRGVIEFGTTLISKARELDAEGLNTKFPYQEQVERIAANERQKALTPTDIELLLTNLYLFYAGKVYKGLDDTTTTALGWLLPRKELSYTALLDSIMADPALLERNDSVLFGQYYKLRDVLQYYRDIEKRGGWKLTEVDPKIKSYKPGDSALALGQIRERLFITGDLKQNNLSNRYDQELEEGVRHFQLRNGRSPNSRILPALIKELNVPVEELIRKIVVNMERCRWISPEFAKAREYIVVNIPSFTLDFIRDGKVELESPVVVGKVMTETVVFSGMMSYIVFCPYWNVPQSIINKEVKPGMKKNKNYLEAHNMEWNNGQVRQKPGKNNSLGLVKFIFPNSNDIYMHDTPAKSLFARESRAFSHGCIRVGKPRDLAIAILQEDPAWTPARIDAAMHAGKENTCVLKEKIPVYIGYLTAWVDAQGVINFYPDIYQRDERLLSLLLEEK